MQGKHLALCCTQMLNNAAGSWDQVAPYPTFPGPPLQGLSPRIPCQSALSRGTRQTLPAKERALVPLQRKPHKPPVGPVGSLVPLICHLVRVEA